MFHGYWSFTAKCLGLITVFVLVAVLSSATANNGPETSTCSADRKLPDQPKSSHAPPIVKKCCRDGENLRLLNMTIGNYKCHPHDFPLYVNYSIVELYEDCLYFRNQSVAEIGLKDGGKVADHEYFPCMYYGELHGSFIIQNASLLVANTFGHFDYRLSDEFCIEADAHTGMYLVCYDVDEMPVEDDPSQYTRCEVTIIQKLLTIISIPCFISIAVLYTFVKEFRNLHGVCVISLCSFLTVEFVLQSVLNNMKGDEASTLRSTVEYFDLMNHFWVLVLFTNTLLFIWIYLPYKNFEWRPFRICSYCIFFIFCMIIPATISSRLREDQTETLIDFLTTPKTTIILICILVLITTFMGSNRLTSLMRREIMQKYYDDSTIDEHDIELQRHHFEAEEVQNRLSCLTSLAGWMTIMRIFSVPGHQLLIVLRESLRNLQGPIFVLIFIGLRYKDIRNYAWRRLKS